MQATFFPHSNFRQDAAALPRVTLILGLGGYDKSFLQRFRMHDAISSVRVPSGLRVTLFRDERWSGDTRILTADASSLDGFNDLTSSILIEDTRVVSSSIALLYQDHSLRGSFQALGPGEYRKSDLSLGNDVVSSARIPDGILAVLFQDDGFGGRVLGLDKPISNLQDKDFGDRTSSVVVYAASDFQSRVRPGQASARQIGDHPRIAGFQDPLKQTIETAPVLIGEVLLPFIYVDDPDFSPETRGREFPYYLLRREQFWKKLYSFDHLSTTEVTEEKKFSVGVVRKDSHSTETTETLTVGIEAEVVIPVVKELAHKLKGTIERKLETKVTQDSETTKSESVERTVTRRFQQGSRVYVAGWAIVDRYTVVRLEARNEESSIAVWEAIVPDQVSEDSFVDA